MQINGLVYKGYQMQNFHYNRNSEPVNTKNDKHKAKMELALSLSN